ncbi:pre-mRNA-splicing factor CWC25-like [Odontomachus brunneus]|uniref:pre-mRNA-splicing factor CWC25-like n=1 Tax=Odontomachus brunneus TaxID=486640 RepID=UPI0013F221EF|nr:pre-mRNA-splicing factor CWC25-like [Odontomachus brunneus]
MMKRVMELLGRLILNEVQRKTCVSLSADMREFLGWILEVDREEESLDNAPPLPLVREEIVPEEDSGPKFLFDNTSDRGRDVSDLQKKVRVLESLVKEYNALTAQEKTRVHTVHDYLTRQLNSLLQQIEALEETRTEARIGAAKARTGSILQYQNAMPNTTNTSYPMTTRNTFSSPIDTRNFRRLDNATSGMADRVAVRRRETRSLDETARSKRRRGTRKRQRNENRGKPKRKPRRKHRDRARSSRRKRANPEGNRRASLDSGYEAPTIYDSLDVIDTGPQGERRKRERESESEGMADLLPIKGKNRLEDEVILLNKREAWRRENEEQLEEVAFGKDMRSDASRERERFEKLTEEDKRKSRTKREELGRAASGIIAGANRSDDSRAPTSRAIGTAESGENSKGKSLKGDNNFVTKQNDLRSLERGINVFADNESETAGEQAGGKLTAINARSDNRVRGRLGAINCETKIDNASDGGGAAARPANSTAERREVPETRREMDDNATKLNRPTNRRAEQAEVKLKNLRRPEDGKRIRGVVDHGNSTRDDDDPGGNKLRDRYVARLDKPADPDPGNNLQLLRSGSDERLEDDVVGWRITPIIRGPVGYNDRALSSLASAGEGLIDARDLGSYQ